MSKETEFRINLTDLQLCNLAENIPPDKALELGLNLGLTKTELDAIFREDTDPVQTSFQVLLRWRSNLDPILIHWRNKVDGRQTERIKLESALRQSGLDLFVPCIDAHVTRKESESSETLPTVNLSLPHGAHNADVIHELEITANLSGESDSDVSDTYKGLLKLLMQPRRSDHEWRKIQRTKSLFEPHGKLTNIEMPPLRFSVDVFSLQGLNHLKRTLETGRLESELMNALFPNEDVAFLRGLKMTLEYDNNSFQSGVRFFKALDPTLSEEDAYPDMTSEGASQIVAQDFNAWTTPKPNSESSNIPSGANLVWRNISQQNFGF